MSCASKCIFVSPTAIFNEQQAGNGDVAVTSLYCLLLHNVYITNFGVSSLSDVISFKFQD